MRKLMLFGLALGLAACSVEEAQNEAADPAPAANAAATNAETINTAEPAPAANASSVAPQRSNQVEVRLKFPSAALPAGLRTDGVENGPASRTEITGADLAALESIIGRDGTTEDLPPKCFRVCESECHEVDGRTICFRTCHIECF